MITYNSFVQGQLRKMNKLKETEEKPDRNTNKRQKTAEGTYAEKPPQATFPHINPDPEQLERILTLLLFPECTL